MEDCAREIEIEEKWKKIEELGRRVKEINGQIRALRNEMVSLIENTYEKTVRLNHYKETI